MLILPDLDVLRARLQLSSLNNAAVPNLTTDEAMALVDLLESEKELVRELERDLETLEYDLENARDELHALKDENVELMEKGEALKSAISNVVDRLAKDSK